MKSTLSATLAALLLAACGAGGDAADSGAAAQSKQLHRTSKTTAADYEEVVQSLYIAYFGRPADPAGLANFETMLAADQAPTNVSGLAEAYSADAALKTLIDGFANSTESQNLYAGSGTQAFVTAVFQHVLGRDPATSGLNYWMNAINTDAVTQGDAALAIMGGAQTNPASQADAQLIANRVAAAEYFTTRVAAQLLTSAYTGATAGTEARNMLALVTASTDPSAFQAQENSTIAALPNIPPFTGTTSAYTGAALIPFNTGGNAFYDAAGSQYGIDESSYGIVSMANDNYLTGLQAYPSYGLLYVVSQGNIIGYLDFVTGPNGAKLVGIYYTGNNQMGQAQINASASAWSLGCTGACVSNTSTSATPVALQEIDTTMGAGAAATLGKTVTVSYTGWLYDVNAANFEGSEFDSSSLHTGSYSFTLGAGKVIPGWDIGVQGMKVGGTRTLIVPSVLGYGTTGYGTAIPPNAGLVFAVQLQGVQ